MTPILQILRSSALREPFFFLPIKIQRAGMYATLTKTRTALAQYGTRCGGSVAGLRASVPASLPASAAALGLPVRSLASVKRAELSDGTHFLLILGKPGGGKGTISGKILSDIPAIQHLSSGDLLRQHVRDQTEIGKEAKGHMDEGRLVPDDLMIRLIMNDATSIVGEGKSLLLDGFPRTLDQARALDESVKVDLVVNLDIPTETIVQRISERWIHPASGRVYNLSYNPPKVPGRDDDTGDELEQREDDKPESVRRRLGLYDEATAPLVDFYESKGVLKTFQGTMSDVIYPEVKTWLDGKLAPQ